MAYTIDSTTVSVANGDAYDTHIAKHGGWAASPAKSNAILIFLMGSGQTSLADGLTRDAPTPITEANNGNMIQDDGGADWPFMIAAAYVPPTASWAVWQVRNTIQDIIDNAAALKVDVSQIYLCGLSLGGIGVHGWMFMDDQNIRFVDHEDGRIQAVFPASGSNWNLDSQPLEENASKYGRFTRLHGVYGANDPSAWVSSPTASTGMPQASIRVNNYSAGYYELDAVQAVFNIDNKSGEFIYNEVLSWTGGTGRILRKTSSKLWLTLESGVSPSNDLELTGADSSETADVNGSVSNPAHVPDAWGVHYANHGNVSAGSGMYQFIKEQIVLAPPFWKAVLEDATPTKLKIYYDRWFDDLNTDPVVGDFAVSGGRTIDSLTVIGGIVELTVNTAYQGTDEVTVSYTKGTNPLADANGNESVNLVTEDVINNIIVIAPEISTITIENATPTEIPILYDTTLDTGIIPATTDFSVSEGAIIGVGVLGSTVTLTVVYAYGYGDEITASYVKGANPITASVGGVEAAGFTDTVVTNGIVDTTAPSIPDGLISSSIVKNAFRLDWDASNDGYAVTPAPPVLSGGKTILGTTDGNVYDSDGLEVEIPAGMDVNIMYLRAIVAGTVGAPTMIVGEPGNRPVIGNNSSVNHLFSNIGADPESTNFEAHYLELDNTLTGGAGSGIVMGAGTTHTNHKFSDIIVKNVPFAGVFCNTNSTTKGYGNLVYENLRMFQNNIGGNYGGEGFYIGTTGNKTSLNHSIDNLQIHQVWAEGFGREGLQLTDCADFMVDRCTFLDCGASSEGGQNRGVQIHNSNGEIRNSVFQGAQGGSIEIFAEGVIFRNCYFSWDTDTVNGIWTLDNYGASARNGGSIQFIDCIFDPTVAQSAATFEIHQDDVDIIFTNCKQGPNAHANLVFDTRVDKVTFDIIETNTTAYTGGIPTYAYNGKANVGQATFGRQTNNNLYALEMGYASQASAGVQQYEVLLDSVSQGVTSSRYWDFSSLIQDTQYSITVNAEDYDANVSADSTPLLVTTLEDAAAVGIVSHASALI